jgi:hypothetical protein
MLATAFKWMVPGIVLAGPGVLVLLAVMAQLLLGSAWLPTVRRWLGGFGLRRRGTASFARQ